MFRWVSDTHNTKCTTHACLTGFGSITFSRCPSCTHLSLMRSVQLVCIYCFFFKIQMWQIDFVFYCTVLSLCARAVGKILCILLFFWLQLGQILLYFSMFTAVGAKSAVRRTSPPCTRMCTACCSSTATTGSATPSASRNQTVPHSRPHRVKPYPLGIKKPDCPAHKASQG